MDNCKRKDLAVNGTLKGECSRGACERREITSDRRKHKGTDEAAGEQQCASVTAYRASTSPV